MSSKLTSISTLLLIITSMSLLFHTSEALSSYKRSKWDTKFPSDDPFGVMEESLVKIPRNIEMPLALLATAVADWRETATEHLIMVDIPGMKKEDVKIEVEENRVVKISGERKEKETEKEGEKWHKAERTNAKFRRQFKMPANADLDQIKAMIEDGVLKVAVTKYKETKNQSRVIDID